MTTVKHNACGLIVLSAIAGWIVVSCAALPWILRSWLVNERVDGVDTQAEEQRSRICRSAGQDEDLVNTVELLTRDWPLNARYSISGGAENSQYIKYLLAPRIPSGETNYTIVMDSANGATVFPASAPSMPCQQGIPKTPAGFIASLFIVAGLGFLLARLLPAMKLSAPECIGGAMILIMGVVILSKVIAGGAVPGMMLLAAAGGAGIVFLLFFLLKGRLRPVAVEAGTAADAPPDDHDPLLYLRGGAGRFLSAAAFLIAFSGIVLSLVMSVSTTVHDWDAWAIWGPRAKVLALGSGPLEDVTHFVQPDYPLLWPALWAVSAWCSGGWEEQWSRGWGAVLLALTAWQIAVVTARLSKRRDLGVLAGALFVSVPGVILISTSGMAEASLWLLITCAFGRLLAATETDRASDILLAGIFTAGAAYTKNEGIFFALVMLGWLIAFSGRGRLRSAMLFAASFALLYLPWFWWTGLHLHLGSQVTDGFAANARVLMPVLKRMVPGLQAVAASWRDPGQWSVVLILVALGVVFVLARGASLQRKALVIPVVMIIGAFLIVAAHSFDVRWQVETAWDRLTMQTLPLLIIPVVSSLATEPRPATRVTTESTERRI